MSIETKINNIVGKLTLDDDFVGQGANAKIENSQYMIQQWYQKDWSVKYHVWRANFGGGYVAKDFTKLEDAIKVALNQSDYDPNANIKMEVA